MKKESIELVFSKIDPRRHTAVSVRTNEKEFWGWGIGQNKENVDSSLWDFELLNGQLLHGYAILNIGFNDGMHTWRYSDEYPNGLITGKSDTSRHARPYISLTDSLIT